MTAARELGSGMIRETLGLPHDNGFRVLGHLVGAERCMKAAHHDRDRPFSVLAGDLVGSHRRIRLDAQCHQVRRLIVRNLLKPVVVKHALHIGRCEARQHAQAEWFHAGLVHIQAVVLAADVGESAGFAY